MNLSEPRFINRELSWLEFNQRVLVEARDARTPPLERLKFLAITGSNLDEFFMVRVGGLQMLARQGGRGRDAAGLTIEQQLAEISERTLRMVTDQHACLAEIESALVEGGVRRVGIDELTDAQSRSVERQFEIETFAVVTPMPVDPEGAFPLLENLSLQMLVRLEGEDGEESYAVIPLGRAPSRFVTLPAEGGYAYILLEEIVRSHIDRFFPGENVVECVPFRITRNADLAAREDKAFDLLETMQGVLDERKESHCVRLSVEAPVSSRAREFLVGSLGVRTDAVYEVSGPLDLSAFVQIAGIAGFEELKDTPWPPQPSPLVDPKTPMFDVISDGDVLLHHPFESFDPVVRLLEEAAEDPDVLAIKQVLYRAANNSRIVAALKRAADRGKYVTAVVELRARFDEARNIDWARELERSAVQVIYGLRGLKIHAKVCVVVRREPGGIRRYVHYGTGNYNESTARLYTDVGLLTCDDDLGSDATTFFNAVNGYSQLHRFRKLEIAPISLRERLLSMIRAEEEHVGQGSTGRIVAKVNSLVDPELIDALYSAAAGGVGVHLIVRGICCLRPGVPGLSENIRVVSIVDRFLEHSRIFHFHHGGDDLVYISSADWMPRNLDRRVELLIPVEDPASQRRLLEILRICLEDDVKGRWLGPDGTYRFRPKESEAARSQEALYQAAKQTSRAASEARLTKLEPHRSPKVGT